MKKEKKDTVSKLVRIPNKTLIVYLCLQGKKREQKKFKYIKKEEKD